ncbi:Lichenase-2 [Bienertia sinuspersici]
MGFFSRNCTQFAVLLTTVIINLQLQLTINYGMQADNLPSSDAVIAQYKKENIPLMRLFDPSQEALKALRGSGIRVSVGVKNEDVTNIAMDVNAAMKWVNTNVAPYIKEVDIKWITVGNEMVPGPGSNLIPQAMNNILSGLNAAGISQVKVSTVVNAAVLGASSPPSAGTFSADASADMQGIVVWLAGTNNPLLVNLYPYFAYAENPGQISLDYALFKAQQPVVDGQYSYYSLFEAMVDAFNAALEKVSASNVTIVVSETGWPSAGNDPYTSKENAQSYNQNLIDKMKSKGTPRKPSNIMDIFIFAMFNEDKKPSGVEQNWGLHYPNMDPVTNIKVSVGVKNEDLTKIAMNVNIATQWTPMSFLTSKT